MDKVLFSILFMGILVTVDGAEEDDRLGALPGVNFHYEFNHYSGYLNAGNNGKWKFFYWLVESQTGNSNNDPLIVWYNGGPGCSSVTGMLEELGPFHYANILAIESPIGTGFSYDIDDPMNYTVGDDLTAFQNLASLIDFFTNTHPRYRKRQWFIAGESYCGISIPTLTRVVLQSIQDGTFPNPNFGGIAIGNGVMNFKLSVNTLVHWAYHHGIIGIREWDIIKKTCCPNIVNVDECPFADHFNPIFMNDSKDDCGNMLLYHLNVTIFSSNSLADPYNFYQDCYKSSYLTNEENIIDKVFLGINNLLKSVSQPNYDSTDNLLAFPCYSEAAANFYMNQLEVQKAFRVDDFWIKGNGQWGACRQYADTTEVFNDIIKLVTDPKLYVPNFRILIYNGDVDTVSNFMGNAKHIDNIANVNGFDHLPRYPWIFRNRIAGYHDPYLLKYNNGQNTLFMDVLTVKGAGHLVPTTRPGPGSQIMYNFIKNLRHYNLTEGFNDNPSPTPDFYSSMINTLILVSFFSCIIFFIKKLI